VGGSLRGMDRPLERTVRTRAGTSSRGLVNIRGVEKRRSEVYEVKKGIVGDLKLQNDLLFGEQRSKAGAWAGGVLSFHPFPNHSCPQQPLCFMSISCGYHLSHTIEY